jgi:hypothetical protein
MRKLELLIREQVRDGREALSINEFCALENISRSTFEKWRKMNIAPVFKRFPGMTLQRLSRDDYAAWKKKQAKQQRQWADTVAVEAAARVERAAVAGRISAAGPRHVSKQNKRKARQQHQHQRPQEERRER